jgi:S1-C subfamily serine protease
VLVNGASVSSVDDIHRLLVGKEAGSLVTLTVLRGGKRREITVISGEA